MKAKRKPVAVGYDVESCVSVRFLELIRAERALLR